MIKNRTLDFSEKLAESYLHHRGYSKIVFEPDGNIPPDFLVDGRIAIEVRRLNQQYDIGQRHQGLEEVAIPLWQKINKLVLSFGNPTTAQNSWFVFYSFRRPLEDWTLLESKIRMTLLSFMKSPSRDNAEWKLGDRFKLRVARASNLHATFYVMGGYSDREAGGWVLAEMEKNLRICITEKTHKISAVRTKYPEWWLVLADHIGYGLDEYDRQLFRETVPLSHTWDKIILIDPRDHTRAFEI